MDRKGQGGIEYLLLLGGALLIAALVIMLLNGIFGPPGLNCEDLFDSSDLEWKSIDFQHYCFSEDNGVLTLKQVIYIDDDWKKASDYIETEKGYISKEEIRRVVG